MVSRAESDRHLRGVGARTRRRGCDLAGGDTGYTAESTQASASHFRDNARRPGREPPGDFDIGCHKAICHAGSPVHRRCRSARTPSPWTAAVGGEVEVGEKRVAASARRIRGVGLLDLDDLSHFENLLGVAKSFRRRAGGVVAEVDAAPARFSTRPRVPRGEFGDARASWPTRYS